VRERERKKPGFLGLFRQFQVSVDRYWSRLTVTGLSRLLLGFVECYSSLFTVVGFVECYTSLFTVVGFVECYSSLFTVVGFVECYSSLFTVVGFVECHFGLLRDFLTVVGPF